MHSSGGRLRVCACSGARGLAAGGAVAISARLTGEPAAPHLSALPPLNAFARLCRQVGGQSAAELLSHGSIKSRREPLGRMSTPPSQFAEWYVSWPPRRRQDPQPSLTSVGVAADPRRQHALSRTQLLSIPLRASRSPGSVNPSRTRVPGFIPAAASGQGCASTIRSLGSPRHRAGRS